MLSSAGGEKVWVVQACEAEKRYVSFAVLMKNKMKFYPFEIVCTENMQ
jgi:hypothetical protein